MGSPEFDRQMLENAEIENNLDANDEFGHVLFDLFAEELTPSPQLKQRIMLIIQMQRDLKQLENKQTPIDRISSPSDISKKPQA